MMPSWEAVAHTLAARLVHSNFCDAHYNEEPAANPTCPFCADRLAYEEYVAKCHSMGRRAAAIDVRNEPMVPLSELRRQRRLP